MRYVKFVVLTSSRTGSTWLVDLLNTQKGVEAHGELFLGHPRLSPAIAGRADSRRFIEVHGTPSLTRMPRVVSYLNKLYGPQRTVGFKLMYSQLRNYPEILVYLAIRRVRFVHLVRRNHIDVIVSEELARLTGRSHAQVGSASDVPMIYLEPTTLIDRIRRLSRKCEEARRLIRLSTCPILEVAYELLLEGEQEFRRIFEFLDISPSTTEMRSSLAKRGTGGHRDAIVNYDQIKLVLNATPYLSMLR